MLFTEFSLLVLLKKQPKCPVKSGAKASCLERGQHFCQIPDLGCLLWSYASELPLTLLTASIWTIHLDFLPESSCLDLLVSNARIYFLAHHQSLTTCWGTEGKPACSEGQWGWPEVAWRDACGQCVECTNLCSKIFSCRYYIFCNYIFSSSGMKPVPVPQS